MEKKFLYGVLALVSCILALSFIFPHKPKVYDLQNVSFATQTNAVLFFKNTRAYKYAREEMPAAAFEVYRPDSRLQTDTLAYLNFGIILNWRADEAYIFAEPSFLIASQMPVEILAGDTVLVFNKAAMNNEDYFRFSAIIFEALLADKIVIFKSTGTNVFGNAKNENTNKTVLKDYFRLINKYR